MKFSSKLRVFLWVAIVASSPGHFAIAGTPDAGDFVSIPAGTFMMGSPEDEDSRWSDEKFHRVEITKSFEIARTEVTQFQWFLVMGSNPSRFSKQENCPAEHQVITDLNGNDTSLCPNHPVEHVSWDDVQSFLAKLNVLKVGEGYTYRLPTEAEWEYAARGRTASGEVQQGAYTFGNDSSLLPNYGWYRENFSGQTHAVGQRRANSYGLFDVHGNVWEWCQDWYNGDYDQSGKREKLSDGSEGFKDPQGSESGSARVLRGGGWYCYPGYLRSAARRNRGPGYRNDYVGLRVVRTHP
ncbi:MAG: formylglycine-generating enzyme family protein [Deltaproteobacteria bacterium]|nr:formylglycine-generating enzyme family protein [Deltaproteobacteria bacterium]